MDQAGTARLRRLVAHHEGYLVPASRRTPKHPRLTRSATSPGAHRYTYGGVSVESPVPVAGLHGCRHARRDAAFAGLRLLPRVAPARGPGRPLHAWAGPWGLALWETHTGWLYQTAGGVEFRVDAGVSRITWYPGAGNGSPAAQDLLVRLILPRVLERRGRRVLHAA